MRKHKTLSSLSMAAIVMLFAAIPALAQGNGSTAAEKSNLYDGSGLEIALNREPRTTTPRTGFLSVERRSIVEAAPVTSIKPLSLTGLKSAGTGNSAFTVNPFQAPRETQLVTDNGGDKTKWGLTFVPSNGPKAPGVKAVRDLSSKK